jgi:hypothetical protein
MILRDVQLAILAVLCDNGTRPLPQRATVSHHRLLTLLSVMAMALLAVHLADDFLLGFDKNVVATF